MSCVCNVGKWMLLSVWLDSNVELTVFSLGCFYLWTISQTDFKQNLSLMSQGGRQNTKQRCQNISAPKPSSAANLQGPSEACASTQQVWAVPCNGVPLCPSFPVTSSTLFTGGISSGPYYNVSREGRSWVQGWQYHLMGRLRTESPSGKSQ